MGPELHVQKQKEGYDCRRARGAVCACMTRLEQQGRAALLQAASLEPGEEVLILLFKFGETLLDRFLTWE